MDIIYMYQKDGSETRVTEVPKLISSVLDRIWGSWTISMIDNLEGTYLSNEAFQALRALSNRGYYTENNLAHLHPTGIVMTANGSREMTLEEKFSLLKLHLHRLMEAGLRNPDCKFTTKYSGNK